ncbi:TetR/AcrR family transcriptional regulator [Caulobacter sp. RL271]|jgi:AcrR family transcriptional regulator|uniref:TetR/AcrR family transcriptional regulator n=1 Tax=Caulobacter segnis TaxID=88688 RepID=A0ABY5A0H1_9CAUL|nr:TetR/AcrR family transcriptional regulator [Caulobacter segnis]USQ98260.1 TetR/AcrR family transcriptional regulator [Caulobacter segnis]
MARRTAAKTTTAKTPVAKTGAPSLDTKSRPSRRRGKDTFEIILTTAGELLAEVGFERLTTNLVCERAGLTPPALYRYFPNKYALLKELAQRLMEAQDKAVLAWLEAGGTNAASIEESVAKNRDLQKRINAITREFPGGDWILRALRALPVLQEVQTTSRDMVAQTLFDMLKTANPGVAEDRLRTATRLTTQMMYAATEMVLEEPGQDEDQINEEICWMVALYYQHLTTSGGASRAG